MLPIPLPDRVILDTSIPRRFSQPGIGCLYKLVSFLGDRACACSEVVRELQQGSNARDAQELRNVLNKTRWPSDLGGVPPGRLSEATRILAELREPGDPPTKNVGEVATVLVAKTRGISLILMDDRDGRKLARVRGIQTISAAQLAIHMTAAAALDYEEGLQVFLVSAPATSNDFDVALAIEVKRLETRRNDST